MAKKLRTTAEEIAVKNRYDTAIRTFKPIFGNHHHLRLVDMCKVINVHTNFEKGKITKDVFDRMKEVIKLIEFLNNETKK